MVKRRFVRLLIVAAAAALPTSPLWAQGIIPTPYSDQFKGTVMINGQPAPVGTVIDAFDPDGVNNGRDTTRFGGLFGYFAAYGDDVSNTPALDEGARENDPITFRILGRPAAIDSGDATWNNMDTSTVHLSVSGVTIGLLLVDAPLTGVGSPRDTVRFEVGIRNTGNIRDFYDIIVEQSKVPAWGVIYPAELVYNGPDSTAYLWFDVVVADFPGEPPLNHLTYTVRSRIDTTATASGTVDLDVDVVGTEDRDELLPGAFALAQNYPNPFNPTTTIAFTLPRASTVRLEVYNTLGRLVEERDLGTYPVGDHAVAFDGTSLASGVYLYRVATEYGSASRKMVLMK
ncbi:MAG TPA: T9SS type A sorting domain-containing protein [candidate division Zixibacteria bacterium]|nr:T9SS type A sorting domain-containing protein [candidate division Zixibacteria bacterium]MDD4916342.1 T9SS type A sorting domain-containing protein [candidate division Zixibacteria bacterium]HOD66368.1 T9SS type A sorting domain-containing protein [candidate division Zixibacteria bacterium]HQL23612.1 T9SS type A sorting domain-containing protein [candidate division Zixibacteria bacterium]